MSTGVDAGVPVAVDIVTVPRAREEASADAGTTVEAGASASTVCAVSAPCGSLRCRNG